VAEQFDGISAIARPVRENRHDRSFRVVAERLVDLVTDCEFGSHGGFLRTQALRLMRLKCGFSGIGKTSIIGPIRHLA
jgi:hypothetical protein